MHYHIARSTQEALNTPLCYARLPKAGSGLLRQACCLQVLLLHDLRQLHLTDTCLQAAAAQPPETLPRYVLSDCVSLACSPTC